MPNVTFSVALDRPPVIEVVVAVTEERAEYLKAKGLHVPLPVVVGALLDTGAQESLISEDIATELDWQRRGIRDILGVGGNISVTGYIGMISLYFPGLPPHLLTSSAQVVAVPNLNHLGARMILGRDLLKLCVLIYNGPHSTCTFAF